MVAAALAGSAFGGLVQKPNLVVPPAFAPYKEEVKKMFTDSYGEYKYVYSLF